MMCSCLDRLRRGKNVSPHGTPVTCASARAHAAGCVRRLRNGGLRTLLLPDTDVTDMTIRYAILDTETTGLHARRGDRIIELAVLLVDEHLEEVDRLDTLFTIDGPVAGSDIHGITDAELVGAPRFEDVLPRLEAMLREVTLVAHYAKFDVAFLHAELVRCGGLGRIGCDVVDTRDLARAAGVVGSLRLADCCAEFGIANERPHRAMGDVLTTRDLLATCVARGAYPVQHARRWNDVVGVHRVARAVADVEVVA